VARLILAAGHADDVRESVKGWLRRAEMDEDIYYFSIHADEELVGQIFLHDIDETAGEALVGYHLFDYQARGRGVGTKALQLLQRFVQTETTLKRLILITSADNAASRRAAERPVSPMWVPLGRIPRVFCSLGVRALAKSAVTHYKNTSYGRFSHSLLESIMNHFETDDCNLQTRLERAASEPFEGGIFTPTRPNDREPANLELRGRRARRVR
jgi:hypothetical protein